jgi:hypothetical protein
MLGLNTSGKWIFSLQDVKICTVYTMPIHGYGNNSIRRSKQKKRIEKYGLNHWLKLPGYIPEEDIRHMLKAHS